MKGPISDLHIDDFCKDTARILLKLYKRFPVKTTLYVEDICGPDEPDEFGLHSPRFEACFGTLIWLKESDYIHYSSLIKQEAVEDATLSHRGFSLISSYDNEAPIENIDVMIPARRIDRLKHVLTNGTSDQLKELVLTYMMKSRDYK